MDDKPMRQLSLRVVAFQEAGMWVAQCVDIDIAAHADRYEDLEEAFVRVVMQNICVNSDLGREELDGIPAPPSRYRRMFDEAPPGPPMRVSATPPPKRRPSGKQPIAPEFRVIAEAA